MICIFLDLALIAKYLLPRALSMKYRIFWEKYLTGRAPHVWWIIPEGWLVCVCTVYLLQGRFRLCYRGGQEDQWDLDSHLCHLFREAQLVLGDPRTMLNINNAIKIGYRITSNLEILCEQFQTSLYPLSFFSCCLLRWQLFFFLNKQSDSSSQLREVRSCSYPCTWSSWTSNCALWTQGTLWRKGNSYTSQCSFVSSWMYRG